MMVIGYTRSIVGCKTDQLSFRATTDNKCVLEFVKDLQDPTWLDVALLKSEPKEVIAFIEGMYEGSTSSLTRTGAKCFVRKEAMTRLFYYSSTIDSIFRLLLYIRRELNVTPNAKDLASLVFFCSRDCKGQLLAHDILNSFSEGKFCDRTLGFQDAYQEGKCLYVLCCQEALHLCRYKPDGQKCKETRTRAKSRLPCFPAFNDLLWQKPGDEKAVSDAIGWFMEIIVELQLGAQNYWKTAQGVYQKAATSKRGFGHQVTMQAFHLAALTTLIPPCYYNVAVVIESKNHGPGPFLEASGQKESGRSAQTTNTLFNNFCLDLARAGHRDILRSTCENYSCGKGQRVRAFELVFFQKNSMQTIMNVVYRPNAKKKKSFQLMIFVDGDWMPFSEIIQPLHVNQGSFSHKTPLILALAKNKKTMGYVWPAGYSFGH